MKSLLILSLTSLISLSAQATPLMISCLDKDNRMSWGVEIKSDLSLAIHNDNDHDIAMKKTKMEIFETYPSQTEVTFEGQDGSSKVNFVYTLETKTGTLYANPGKRDAFQVEFECKLAKDVMNWSEAKQALKDAPSQGGSTRF